MENTGERENQIATVEDVAVKTKYVVMYGDPMFDEEPDEDKEFLEKEITEIEKLFNTTIKMVAFNNEEEDVVTEKVIKVKSNFYEFYNVEFVKDLHCEMRTELEKKKDCEDPKWYIDVYLQLEAMEEVTREIWWRWSICGGSKPTKEEMSREIIWRRMYMVDTSPREERRMVRKVVGGE